MEEEVQLLVVHHEEICCRCGGLGIDSVGWDQGRLHGMRAWTMTIDQKIQRHEITLHPERLELAS